MIQDKHELNLNSKGKEADGDIDKQGGNKFVISDMK